VTKLQKAIKLVSERNYEEAAKFFIEYIEEQPTDPVGFVNFANLLTIMNQSEEAERCFLKAIELDDKTATAYYGLGNLYVEKELYPEAEKMFQHCIKLGLVDADVYYLLGMTYVHRKDMMLALPFLQRATELDKQADTLFQYGLALAQTNYMSEAETVFNEVLQIDRNHADALYNLGVIAVYQDDTKLALAYFDEALQSQSDHALAKQAKENLVKQGR